VAQRKFMSSFIRINAHQKKINVKVAGGPGFQEEVDDAQTLKKQFEEYYERGFKEGQAKIRRELEKDFTDKLVKKYQEFYNILGTYEHKMEEYEQAFEKLVIATAHEISKKILKRELEIESVINQNVRDAIAKIIGANEVKIKLNPADLDVLNEHTRSLINNSSFSKITFEPDERIEQGGCLIETEIGNVDARISTQLEELRNQLIDSIEKR
jgi:flagellar assembly protein FliH